MVVRKKLECFWVEGKIAGLSGQSPVNQDPKLVMGCHQNAIFTLEDGFHVRALRTGHQSWGRGRKESKKVDHSFLQKFCTVNRHSGSQ